MSVKMKIIGTYDTPDIVFEPEQGIFEISGRSLPSNTYEFYTPVMNELMRYTENPKASSLFKFKMDFISSSSTKIFQQIFHELDKLHERGFKVVVNWYYKFGDDDMKELGDDLRLDSKVPCEFIAYE